MTAPLVIGIAGGIGAGKSAAARALGDLGCLVSDSDREAKAELDEPEVRAQLVEWWGGQILGPDDRVDRAAIASVIFEQPAERRRLEALIHPRLRHKRAALRAHAEQIGAPAIVIDAPLLFEAGLDAECDAVVFVDAPREQRLARVRSARGWDEAELDRREQAQRPLAEKRAGSTVVVLNDGDERALRAGVAEFFRRLVAGSDPDLGGPETP